MKGRIDLIGRRDEQEDGGLEFDTREPIQSSAIGQERRDILLQYVGWNWIFRYRRLASIRIAIDYIRSGK